MGMISFFKLSYTFTKFIMELVALAAKSGWVGYSLLLMPTFDVNLGFSTA